MERRNMEGKKRSNMKGKYLSKNKSVKLYKEKGNRVQQFQEEVAALKKNYDEVDLIHNLTQFHLPK